MRAQRTTKQRRAIEAALRAAKRPLNPQEVLDLARDEVENLGIATVYRTLRVMSEAGEISAVQLPGEPPRYEMSHAADHHHHHFHCEKCNRVYDIHGCPTGFTAMLPNGFRLSRHEVVLYGVCGECGAA